MLEKYRSPQKLVNYEAKPRFDPCGKISMVAKPCKFLLDTTILIIAVKSDWWIHSAGLGGSSGKAAGRQRGGSGEAAGRQRGGSGEAAGRETPPPPVVTDFPFYFH